jgi:hypothetical protein
VTEFRTPADALTLHFAWYEKIFDPKVQHSVAWWLQDYTNRRNTLLSRIGNLKLAKDSGFDPVRQMSTYSGLAWICHMEGDALLPFGGPPRSKADTPSQAFLVWRFLSESPDGYPILSLDYEETKPGRYRSYGVDYHRQFEFDPKMLPGRFNRVPPTLCQMTPDRITGPRFQEPEFQKLQDELDLLLKGDGDKLPGLIPQVNDLNARIWLTENIQKIAQSAREAALQLKRDLG